MNDGPHETELPVTPTGVRGLDLVLQGGLLKGGVYIIQGHPGAGKTILGNQLCYSHIRTGGCALYVTLLAESHARMLGHIAGMSFYDPAAAPQSIHYFSAFRVLEEDGLKGLLALLRREVQTRKATMVVLDGLVAAEESAGTSREFKKFIHELQTVAAVTESTMLLLTSAGVGQAPISAEHTMVDGVIELERKLYGRRAERDLIVHKRRGGYFLGGRHSFRITDDGIVVFPRTEALLSHPSRPSRPGPVRVPTGVEGLDRMLGGGGLVGPSAAMLVGPAGCGKTTLGLQFLSGCSEAEPGLLFGFNESPEAVLLQARALGLPLAGLIESGAVEMLWQPPTEAVLDEIAATLLENVDRRGVKRLFLDGYDGLARLAVEPERLYALFTAVVKELEALGVTTLFTTETELGSNAAGNIFAGMKLQDASAVAETLIVMRFVQKQAELHRLVSVLKARNSRIATDLRRFEMTERGVVVEESAEGAQRLLAELDPFRLTSTRAGED